LPDDPKVVDEGDDRLAVLERRLELALAHPGRLVLVAAHGSITGYVLWLVVEAAAHDVAVDGEGHQEGERARQEHFRAGSAIRAGNLDVDRDGKLRVVGARGPGGRRNEGQGEAGGSEKGSPVLVQHVLPPRREIARTAPAGLRAGRRLSRVSGVPWREPI